MESRRSLARLTCLLAVLCASCSPLVNAQTWTLEGPSSRQSHSAVFDPTTAQMIIFGGLQTTTHTNLNDVWLGKTSTNQNDSFNALVVSGSLPQGRYGHVATYDAGSNRMTIFAGALGAPSPCANDVWILDHANGSGGSPNWIAAAPSGTAPALRVYPAAAYDATTNSMIVFGGRDCSTGYFNDVWVLSNANGTVGTTAWTQLAPSGTPPAQRQSTGAVYDSTNNILIVYGGDSGAAPFSDVWVLSNANGTGGTPVWTQLSPTGTPPMARTGHTATYDGVNNRMTIFGGINNSITLTDSWVLISANGIGNVPSWSKITVTGTAPSVAYHSAVYDQKTNNMYAFAGISSADKLATNAHAFTLTGANGISQMAQRWILGGPAVRYSQSAFYDSTTNGLFVFGGQHSKGNLNFNDYWEASGVVGSSNLKWIKLVTKGTLPAVRFGHTGLYDRGSNRMMVFGGAKGFPAPCLNDYYVLQHANSQGGTMTWSAVTPAGTAPTIRTRHSSVYDSSTNAIIIFGGNDCASTYYNDVWILNNANNVSAQPVWTQLLPTGVPPSARQSSTSVYDPTTNTLIVYGGDSGGNPFGDAWLLSNANGTGGTPAWTKLTPSNGGPVARTGHIATYDAQNNVMTIYGGFDGRKILSDTWTLTGANGQAGAATWTQTVSGQVRRFHSSVYDPTSNEMITFGGTSGTVPLVPSADVYTLTHANGLP